jgi:DNA-directed RNA polymerase subunit RPC12/RpoP
MKFLCLDCDEAMKLVATEGPEQGSLTATFRCPQCGFRVAMLTNPFETQLVASLGVKVGARPTTATPFEHLRGAMAGQRPDAFEPASAGAAPGAGTAAGGGCPFAAMVNDGAALTPAGVVWEPDAAARVERIPAFIRPLARRAIERFAESKGYPRITDAVMDEARGAMGM